MEAAWMCYREGEMRGITVALIAVHVPSLCCVCRCGDVPQEDAEVLQMCSELLQRQINTPHCTTGQKKSCCAATMWLETCPGDHTLTKYITIGN